jgi:hypothetical protein
MPRRTSEEKRAQRAAASAERKRKGVRIALSPEMAASAIIRHCLVPVAEPYSPFTDVACEQVGVPYGEVYMSFYGSDKHSHEMLLEGGDPTCFIPPHVAYRDREERRERREAALSYAG